MTDRSRGLKLAQGSALLLLVWCCSNRPGIAQIVPDASLPSNSIVTPNGNNFTVEGGTAAGSNLFHSFREFSLPTGSEVLFDNALTIENIITRVTGGRISEIDGLLRANGSANLFLLNPAGIVFGENASLNIGGSFLASTAESLQLSDGSFYSATNPEAPPLLVVNVPTGLQYGSNPGPIANRSLVPGPDPANPDSSTIAGLAVQPGKTLALIGGDTRLEGGNLTVPSGRVELGGVGENGFVGLTATGNGFAASYEGVENFRDVELSGQALVNGSGETSSEIEIRARNFRILPGARIYARNLGEQAGGNILIASELVEAIGTGNYIGDFVVVTESDFSKPLELPTGLYAISSGTGAGGSIEINARQVSARDSAFITVVTTGAGRGGDLTINASESVRARAARVDSIAALESLGDSGNLTVNTGRLTLQEAGILSAATNGAGRGGDLVVNASESIELLGSDLLLAQRSDGLPIVLNSALLAATAASGDAGEMRLSAPRLILRGGAALVPNSAGSGRPGNAIITASESVELIGTSPPGAFAFPSSILASAIDPSATTEGGNATIITENFILRDGAAVIAQNFAVGGGGRVEVAANRILLDDATIGVTTAFGQGGNIRLQARDILLRRNSEISATAGSATSPVGSLPPEAAAFFAPLVTGVGDGGNIVIETENLVALENSDIIANAQEGVGGRVSITARGIFGIQFRPVQTPRSDITATSALGPQFSGIVEINTPDAEPASGLVELPEETTDPSDRIVTGCAAERGNSFTVTGRGGLPEDPAAGLLGRTLWWDARNPLSIAREATGRPVAETGFTPSAIASAPANASEAPGYSAAIVEATGWRMNTRGEVELVAQIPAAAPWYKPARCQDVGQEGIVGANDAR